MNLVGPIYGNKIRQQAFKPREMVAGMETVSFKDRSEIDAYEGLASPPWFHIAVFDKNRFREHERLLQGRIDSTTTVKGNIHFYQYRISTHLFNGMRIEFIAQTEMFLGGFINKKNLHDIQVRLKKTLNEPIIVNCDLEIFDDGFVFEIENQIITIRIPEKYEIDCNDFNKIDPLRSKFVLSKHEKDRNSLEPSNDPENTVSENTGRSRKRLERLPGGEPTVVKKVSFPTTLAAELDRAAKAEGVSFSRYVNELVADAMTHNEPA